MSKPTITNQKKKTVRWRIHDLIDLEYFLHRDVQAEENDSPQASTERDIYLARLRNSTDSDSPPSRRVLIKGWLDAMREKEEKPLPGEVFLETRRMAVIAAVVFGLVSGIGMALSLLGYTGTEPLNVSVYLGLAVFSQMLLLFLLLIVFCFRAAGRSLVRGSVLAGLLGRLLTNVVFKARNRALKSMDGPRREAIAAATGLLRGRKKIYGTLFFWPVFVAVQGFAVCFNVGLLGATLLRLTGTDVAFGWQSTFQVGSRVVFRIVETIALPWSGFLPRELAHPSLAQIEGSRMILKEGIYHLSTTDLVSWWPFLCLSVIFYGLLPRLILLVSGIAVQRRLLTRLRFDHGDCDALVNRMLSPVVRTAGRPSAAIRKQDPPPGEEISDLRESYPADNIDRFVALVPDDIFGESEGLDAVAAEGLALQLTDKKKIGGDSSWNRSVFDFLGEAREDAGFDGVLLLQEAWQPPIQETLMFLKQLRERLGKTGKIVVALIGKPSPDTIFTPVREEDWRIWKKKTGTLGDPYLRLERLLTHDG